MTYYTSMGAIPAAARPDAPKRDEMLARTTVAAKRILRQLDRLPQRRRVAALDRVLRNFDATLPERFRRVGRHLKGRGLSTNRAVERALALSLADASIERIKKLGRAYQKGMVMPLAGGMGAEGDDSEGDSPEETVGKMFQGIVCSEGLQSTVTDMVGRQEGRDAAEATAIGYEVGQGFAMCPAQQPTPTTPTAPAPSSEEDRPSMVLPIAVGVGALALVGGVVWWTQRD